MGYWGPKSFENDYALNILGEFSHELSTVIEEGSGKERAAQYDEEECDKLIVDMEIYLALAAQNLPMENHPDPVILGKNLPGFESTWKGYMVGNGLDGDEHWDERLEHIKGLWGRVIETAKKLRVEEDDDDD